MRQKQMRTLVQLVESTKVPLGACLYGGSAGQGATGPKLDTRR